MTHIRILTAALLIVAACKKQPPADVTDAAEPAERVAPEAAARPSAEQIATLRANFSRVYFETDSAQLSKEAQEALAANVEILTRSPRLSIEVQGHADERGTTDYNLALGQKRAENIRRYMISQGVARDRITVVSYGEERPADGNNSEVAWSQNRRAEFRIVRDGDNSGATGTTE